MSASTGSLIAGSIALVIIIALTLFMTLSPKPQPAQVSCTDQYDPVCGINNMTFENACHAKLVNVSISHAGACRPPIVATGNIIIIGAEDTKAGFTSLPANKETTLQIENQKENEVLVSSRELGLEIPAAAGSSTFVRVLPRATGTANILVNGQIVATVTIN